MTITFIDKSILPGVHKIQLKGENTHVYVSGCNRHSVVKTDLMLNTEA